MALHRNTRGNLLTFETLAHSLPPPIPRSSPLDTLPAMSMSFLRPAVRASTLRRSYATITTPSTLIFLEHKAGAIVPATLNAITAAKKIGGTVTGLVVGDEASTKDVVEKAKK
jgi:hypothetical protein